MNAYTLPQTLSVCGKFYPIRSDFRSVLNILQGIADPDLDNEGKALLILMIIYPNWEEIPPNCIHEAIIAANEFIDCGHIYNGKTKRRTVDWKQDAPIIIPAVNSVAHTEVRALPYLHWWTFMGYFMEIGDSLFSSVLHIRNKKASGKKLEKWEQNFYKSNKPMIDIKTPESQRVQEDKENIMKFLRG